MPDLPNVVTWSIPAFLLLVVLEAASFVFHGDDDELGYDPKDTATSLAMGLGNVFVKLIWKSPAVAVRRRLHVHPAPDRPHLVHVAEPEDEHCVYGLTTNIDTYNPLRVAFHEYAAIAHDWSAVDDLVPRTSTRPAAWTGCTTGSSSTRSSGADIPTT